MIGAGLQIILLLFALVGFAGAGASVAVARSRRAECGDRDIGMWSVAVMLFVFGTLCTLVATGLSGVAAFGLVALWAAYVLMAQNLGMFRIELARRPGAARATESRSIK